MYRYNRQCIRSIYNVETVRDGALIRLKVSVDGMSEYPDAAHCTRLYDETCHYNMMSGIMVATGIYRARTNSVGASLAHDN